MWLKFFQGIGAILASLLDTFLRNKEVKDLRDEKLEAKDDAIKLKTIEARIMAEHSNIKPFTIDRLRKHTKE